MNELKSRFWQRWKREYLQSLQKSSKWHETKDSLKIGQLVTIHDRFLPPMLWRLGRVIKKHPGPDGLTRVVTLKTSDGEAVRAISELNPLPLKTSIEN